MWIRDRHMTFAVHPIWTLQTASTTHALRCVLYAASRSHSKSGSRPKQLYLICGHALPSAPAAPPPNPTHTPCPDSCSKSVRRLFVRAGAQPWQPLGIFCGAAQAVRQAASPSVGVAQSLLPRHSRRGSSECDDEALPTRHRSISTHTWIMKLC